MLLPVFVFVVVFTVTDSTAMNILELGYMIKRFPKAGS